MPAGSLRPSKPLPFTIKVFSSNSFTLTPNARMQFTVDIQSAACKKLVIFTSLSHKPENITLRCETDLSPGIKISPDKPFFIG